MINDEDLLVYKGIVDGKESLFIDAKRACDRIFEYRGARNLHAIDSVANGNASFLAVSNVLYVKCNNPVSLILYSEKKDDNETELKGDINGDGKVNVLDITEIVDIFNEEEDVTDKKDR